MVIFLSMLLNQLYWDMALAQSFKIKIANICQKRILSVDSGENGLCGIYVERKPIHTVSSGHRPFVDIFC